MVNNGEYVSFFGYKPKYLRFDLLCFLMLLAIYTILLYFMDPPANTHKLTWIVDRLRNAIPVAAVSTLIIELGGFSAVWFYEYNKERKEQKQKQHEEQLKQEYQRGRDSVLEEIRKSKNIDDFIKDDDDSGEGSE